MPTEKQRLVREAALIIADIYELAGRLRRTGDAVARAVGQSQARSCFRQRRAGVFATLASRAVELDARIGEAIGARDIDNVRAALARLLERLRAVDGEGSDHA